MRLWSIHPSYLDSKGIVALWREGLLARKVLEGKTKGYTNHPQLARFKEAVDPLAAIDVYLEAVAAEATARGYSFDAGKIRSEQKSPQIAVNNGQVAYEVEHLKGKLEVRDPERIPNIPKVNVQVHPLFKVVQGPIEEWEKEV